MSETDVAQFFKEILMFRVVVSLLFFIPSLTLAASQSQLASECQRGFANSCKTLRAMNTGNPQQAPGSSAGQRDQLADECRRGFSASCTALRALNGEQTPKRTVCNTSGYANGGGYGSSYNGTTVCTER